mgnify:CR=1 FL=1
MTPRRGGSNLRRVLGAGSVAKLSVRNREIRTAGQRGAIVVGDDMALKAGMTTKARGEAIFPYLITVGGLRLALTVDKDAAKLNCCAG